MNYAIITENDESKWEDQTGISYHFPVKYINKLKTGTKVIYYKGAMKNKEYEVNRLSKSPHYFGVATIGEISKDEENNRQYFAQILEFIPFENPVDIKNMSGKYFEKEAKDRNNYWRDGVREISEDIYNSIILRTNLKLEEDSLGKHFIVDKKSLPNLEDLSITEERKLLSQSNTKNNNGEKNVSSGRNKKNSEAPRYSKNAKIIGDRAEEIVLQLLKNKGMQEVDWVAQRGEKPGYDIKYTDLNGIEKFVEVKGTTTKKFSNFILTENELDSCEVHREKYSIIFVTECLSNSPKYQEIINPYSYFLNNDWIKKPISYNVIF